MTVPRHYECTAGYGPAAAGLLLVSRQGFNARYDLDMETGVVVRPEHDLRGETLAGRVFVFRGPKGGIATSWALAALAATGRAPAALVCREVNPVIVQGAVLACIPLLAGLPEAAFEALSTGRPARVDPASRRLYVD